MCRQVIHREQFLSSNKATEQMLLLNLLQTEEELETLKENPEHDSEMGQRG